MIHGGEVLVLGPGFGAGPDLEGLARALAPALLDLSDWPQTPEWARLELLRGALGEDQLLLALAEHHPSQEMLRNHVTAEQKALLAHPWSAVISLRADALVEATLCELDRPWRHSAALQSRGPGELLLRRALFDPPAQACVVAGVEPTDPRLRGLRGVYVGAPGVWGATLRARGFEICEALRAPPEVQASEPPSEVPTDADDAAGRQRAHAGLLQRGLPVPIEEAALCADLLAAAGRPFDLGAALSRLAPRSAPANLALGRALARSKRGSEAAPYLRCVLRETAGTHRVEALGWLARCVLESLPELGPRARIESIAAFLARYSADFAAVQATPPEPKARKDLAVLAWRVGELMVEATQLAKQAARLYARQARALLERALDLDPDRPEPKRVLARLG